MGVIMKKIVISLFIILPASVIGLVVYAMETFTIDDLIICSSYNETYYIPSGICEYYLIRHRANDEDIKYLESGFGLGFIATIKDSDKRYKLMDLFISKGLNVNSNSKADGLTALHAAILSNDPKLVEYLLSKKADPLQTEKNHGMTAYQYVDFLISKDLKNNRASIKKLLLAIQNKKT